MRQDIFSKESRKQRRKRKIANLTNAIFAAAFVVTIIAATAAIYKNAKAFEASLDAARNAEVVHVKVTPVVVLEEPEPEVTLYDVPLDEEVQLFIVQECEEHHIEPSVVMAMIHMESRFQADVVGDKGQAFGLMQIQPRWNYQRMLDLDCTDLLDPKQNVTVGINLLAELMDKDKGLEWALTAYNAGASVANQIGCNNYATEVLAKAGEINVLHG